MVNEHYYLLSIILHRSIPSFLEASLESTEQKQQDPVLRSSDGYVQLKYNNVQDYRGKEYTSVPIILVLKVFA